MNRLSLGAFLGLFVLVVGVKVVSGVPPWDSEREMREEAQESMWSEGSTSDEGDASEESDDEDKGVMTPGTFSGLSFRCIGPALTGGRVGDFAVNPNNTNEWYVAVCSGGVWKTVNNGTTFEPVFDGEGSYSIGCVTIDPNDSNVVWVGSGENNSQRSVSWGDGVYKSLDGGKSWKNMGLKDSQHIGMIAVDPRDSNVVYVAAQGPLWNAGGDRGLYKTTDGGATWEKVLSISDDTGVNEVHMDPRNPDVLYASSYQRRRHVWTLIDGGPEGAIYKSTDAGKTWNKLESGIPGEDKGRIGLAVSPANPDVVYAIIEAAHGKSGFFRSTNRGASWEKMSDHSTSSPQYYNEIICDPTDVDTVYALDTFMMVTHDGGKTWARTPREDKHVDNHALWIDPSNTKHMLVGCDGGIYQTWDGMKNWRFCSNLPITQFYRVCTDNSEPFFYVYGGTQDNNSVGGPSRTTDRIGVANSDWFVTVGGDGYETQVDPTDPNTVYAQWQYAGLVRYDRKSGEVADIKPREKPGDAPYVFNWDTPLLISPHSHTRLYLAGRQLFRSEDRGNSWEMLIDDVSRGIDRNTLEIMGRIQPADAVAKSDSTSFYGNSVALSESPVKEGVLYVGSDDGLIHVSADNGKTWRTIKSEDVQGVPERTYVSCLTASWASPDRVFAAFDNHKMGDFKPYLYVSDDQGRTWRSIAGDLPENNVVWTIQEDDEDENLLFCGTEYGAYFTVDGGQHWIKMSGLPTIAVRDMEIQRRDDAIAVATFGRSFYVLDDYTPFRQVSEKALEESDAILYPTPDALAYMQRSRLGGEDGKGSQGASLYAAPNPDFGATFTYYIKDKLKTLREKRHEAEKDAHKEGQTPPYPTIEDLRREEDERTPEVLLTVHDADGRVVRRLRGSRDKGIHRMAWDLRYPAFEPIEIESGERSPWDFPDAGPPVLPGQYTVTLSKVEDAKETVLAGPQSFNVVPLMQATFADEDHAALLAFREKVGRLQRAVRGALKSAGEAQQRIKYDREAVMQWAAAPIGMLEDVEALQERLDELLIDLRGDSVRAEHDEPTSPSINERVDNIVYDQWYVTSAPTQTQRDQYEYAADKFEGVLGELQELIQKDLVALEDRLEKAGAPWTPGRVPTWEKE